MSQLNRDSEDDKKIIAVLDKKANTKCDSNYPHTWDLAPITDLSFPATCTKCNVNVVVTLVDNILSSG